MSKKLKAFTLIELLVVISIIALLSSIGAASLNSTRAKARDAKRKADLKTIALALELYFDANGKYPPAPNNPTYCNPSGYNCSSYASSGDDTTWGVLMTALSPYVSVLPKDSKNVGNNLVYYNGSYRYNYGNVIDGSCMGAASNPFASGPNPCADESYTKWNGPSQYDLVTKLENTNDPDRCELKGYRSNAYLSNDGWCAGFGFDYSPPDSDNKYLYDISPSL